jgi:hypothetical protein
VNARFLNVDLEVESDQALQPLVEGLGESFYSLYCGEAGGHYLATFELSDSECVDADAIINQFCEYVERLEGEAQQLWQGAFKRVFDIGYRGDSELEKCVSELDVITLARVAALGAAIRITIY